MLLACGWRHCSGRQKLSSLVEDEQSASIVSRFWYVECRLKEIKMKPSVLRVYSKCARRRNRVYKSRRCVYTACHVFIITTYTSDHASISPHDVRMADAHPVRSMKHGSRDELLDSSAFNVANVCPKPHSCPNIWAHAALWNRSKHNFGWIAIWTGDDYLFDPITHGA